MRLTEQEIAVLRRAVTELDPNAELFLYGSRADDYAKGGDIDLLILSDKLTFHDKITFLVEVKEALGQQKIDVVIAPKRREQHSDFVAAIMPSAVALQPMR